MAANELELVREQILCAFPPVTFDGCVTECNCEECFDLREALSHKRWDEVPVDFIDFTVCPALLTPESCQAFVPAYMLRGLDHLNGETNVLEFTVYRLCPSLPEPDNESQAQHQDQFLKTLAGLMSPDQVEAIRSFLLFAATNAENCEWLQNFVDPALQNIWH